MAKEKSDDGKCEQERKPTDPDNDETIAYEQDGDHSNHSNKENDELEHEKSRTSKKIVDNSKTGTHLKTTTKKQKICKKCTDTENKHKLKCDKCRQYTCFLCTDLPTYMLITLTKELYYICKNCSETDKEIEEIMSSEMAKDICQSCKKRTKQKEIFLGKQMEEEAVKQEAVIIQLQQENTKKADDIKLKAKTIKRLGDVVKQHEVTAQTIRNEK